MMDAQADQMAYYERWLATVQALAESLVSQAEIDQVYPDLEASYQESMALAEQNVQAGMIETAVGELQRTYHELSIRLTHYRSFTGQYDELRRTAKLKLAKLEQEILHNQQVPGMDLEGRVLPYTIEVNDWVGGDLARLYQGGTARKAADRGAGLDRTDAQAAGDDHAAHPGVAGAGR